MRGMHEVGGGGRRRRRKDRVIERMSTTAPGISGAKNTTADKVVLACFIRCGEGYLLAAILVLILAAFTAWTYHEKLAMMESEIVEQARMLTTEMDATWSFVSANQYTINHDSTGAYDYKGLHCALAGKSVAALFSQHSDTVIRFTKLDPRNSNAEPDEFEEAALRQFEADPRDDEYYGFTEYEGRNVFRYVSEMRVTKDCTECHGEPAGEIDPTGHPKEGWKIGDVGGAMSIIVPTDLYFDNMMASVWNNVMFFLLIMLILGIAVYFALSWMVVRPLESLGASLRAVDADPSRAHTAAAPIGVFDSREMDTLFAHFDSMSSALSVLYGNLESQVGERTDQLRTAMEQLLVDDDIAKFISGEVKDVNANAITNTARRAGMITMLQKGILKALAGETTLEEVNPAHRDPTG